MMPKLRPSILSPSLALACCVCVFSQFPIFAEDEVTLTDGGRLSGNVLSIQEGGAIQLESALASKPLALKGDAVNGVKFAQAGEQPAQAGGQPAQAGEQLTQAGDTRILLSNGDFLTATLLGYSPDGGLRIDAEDMGNLEIPKQHLRSLTMGVRPARTIYQGPDDLANWTSDKARQRQNWRLTDGRLTVDGTGQIGRMLDLSEHYVIRFNLSWQGQPNFQLGFSDPLEEQQTRVDRYYLQFGRAGLEIKREAAIGRRYHTVGTLNRTPDQFPNRNVDIELRVDRNESVIHLSINGQPEGRFMDPFDNPPAAGGITLVSNASAGNQHEIRGLTVENWHQEITDSTRITERREDPTRDALIIRQGDHYSGVLESIRKKDEDLIFTMKVDFREQPMEILGADVAVVHFASKDGDQASPETTKVGDFVLQLHDRGRLAVTRSSFEDTQVKAEHPLLGRLTMSRERVSALERHLKAENSDAK